MMMMDSFAAPWQWIVLYIKLHKPTNINILFHGLLWQGDIVFLIEFLPIGTDIVSIGTTQPRRHDFFVPTNQG